MDNKDGIKSWAEIRAMAELAETIGFESLWVVDHFIYSLENDVPAQGVWEGWSLL
jgi:alkanesulfonate monooxygenase SsuD/methylene tetrahydromethanopterin reductase-like flavin-dependent oxidoreductase (luciferase family)